MKGEYSFKAQHEAKFKARITKSTREDGGSVVCAKEREKKQKEICKIPSL